ncbi:serine hydroxymethyltransferase [Serratia fonticola]|jgi:glycine hydroxymethyltransferase|uniref:Serine hydroxymethyltransferase n=1 Tax=Serratia fonticola TaxID=47917 RepID=A0A448T222_SERFO|nr:serine hydroxymethyltransferase [Serratia fonticola]CAI0885136.1 Pyridoxal-phosphate-dependent serine hydroxymethyltransferase [Serratia fonticola]CAI0893887.1 Pyridoxal-phosphate-dependent serine hydroxymethyltransferase [Serratia fonticola]CAI0904071.1 Pyridoxal-phosphate-dependent serine hydroxymethyltransferase [Serratia fonticola]CAI0975556.1 Pyridoxal-phosphate-dependent serine hydroxymethyltransferase [Serratia fonticola]CAI1520036.1 Pyridoxal-phosphate-dependent serine hydroxymethyl
MLKREMNIADYDAELWHAMEQEVVRQEEHIELIASENYTSPRVMQAQGSQLTNKYAEGYPGKRYYGGCEYVDIVEQLAIDRAKELFGADYANVQPHSGSQANFAVYTALLQPGDTILGMNLAHGGHLTHGSPVNLSGKLYNVVPYGIDESGQIDYNDLAKQAQTHKPKMIIGGFSAFSGVVDWAKMREIADSIGAYLFVDMAHVAGLIAAGVYPNPVPHAHVVTTTTHKTLAGPRGGLILAKGGDEDLYKKLNSAVFPGGQGGPLMHVIAGKAVALKEAMEPEFKVYQQQVADNAKAMVKVFLDRGYKVVSGGTYNHLFLLDLVDKNLTGKEADAALGRANITVNKNSVPNDPKSPFVTSGIRLGTPAVTRRGFKEAEVCELAGWICDVLDNLNDEATIERTKKKVLDICARFPVYA